MVYRLSVSDYAIPVRWRSSVLQLLPLHSNVNRRHNLKLANTRCHYLRKYSFTNRVVNIWSSLPESVATAVSVDSFKNRLDKFWSNQDTQCLYIRPAVCIVGESMHTAGLGIIFYLLI